MSARLPQRNVVDRYTVAGGMLAAIELSLLGFVLWGMVRYDDAVDDRQEARRVVSTIEGTLAGLASAEGGKGAYAIGGGGEFLATYTEGVTAVETGLGQLTDLVRDMDEVASALVGFESTIEAKLSEMEQVMALVEAGQQEDALALMSSVETRELNLAVRISGAKLVGAAEVRLDESSQAADRASRSIGFGSITLTLTTIALLIWFFIALRRQHENRSLREVAGAKDEFVGFVSHELRGPMSIVSGNAHLLSERAQLDPIGRQAAADIVDATHRVESILRTLLSLAKAENGSALEVEPLLIQRVAAAVLRHHRAQFPMRSVELTVAEGVPPAMGDRDALEQVLVNLLSNAEKYGNTESPIQVGIVASADEVTTTVSNFGEAVDRSDFERIFEPFVRLAARRTEDGSGLGLAICHRLVVAQGGRLEADAGPDGRIAFAFSLPIAPDEATEGAP